MRLEKRVNLIYKDYLELDKPREFQKEGITMVSDKPKKMLILNIGDNKVFWTAEGKTIKNLYQLSAALEQMSNETFNHHVNELKNDFSTWVFDVFGENRLAKKLINAKTKQEAQVAVLKHLVSVLSR